MHACVFRCGGQRESALSIRHVGSRDRLRCQPEGAYSFQWQLAACSMWPPGVSNSGVQLEAGLGNSSQRIPLRSAIRQVRGLEQRKRHFTAEQATPVIICQHTQLVPSHREFRNEYLYPRQSNRCSLKISKSGLQH